MPFAHYMIFTETHSPALGEEVVGGDPPNLPSKYPSDEFGPMGFVGHLSCRASLVAEKSSD